MVNNKKKIVYHSKENFRKGWKIQMSKKKKNQWKKIVSLIIVICVTLVGAYIEYNEYMSQLEEQNKAQSEVVLK